LAEKLSRLAELVVVPLLLLSSEGSGAMPQGWQIRVPAFVTDCLQSLAPRKIQESIECSGSDRMSLNPWQVLSGQITQSVSGWNFEE
jgi:hypothetical protein